MATTLTVSQLRSALTADQVSQASTKGVSAGDDPVAEEIAAACAKVDFYTSGHTVPDALATGYARDIAAHQVAKRLGSATDDQVRAYERALKELEDIRDGKFGSAVGTSSAAMIFGSAPRVTDNSTRI